ncbi:transcription antitermination factor NusB [Mordavella massiliensis]|uniref:Transcription antitermination protein NusB n=1 Tax=Mordavella massiliensis TaxID=1871024 RepID=A0A938XFV2_9CLOT|nr:transcription antitermination factor NusB [Mordavella massiliensis]MBM6969873.1 transcription antitermination factor NusB [Mordavella massiliensis]
MKRSELREHIFKLLFGVEFREDADFTEQTGTYVREIEGADEKEQEYIQTKVQRIADRIQEIDELINTHTKGWKTSRMNKVDLTILRLAVYEMKWDDSVPVGVAINEAVELAKKYSSDDGPAFVNGVLAKLAD